MSMTITLILDDELASLLTKKAVRLGVTLEQFVLDALRRVAEMPTISEISNNMCADFEASGITDEKFQQDIK